MHPRILAGVVLAAILVSCSDSSGPTPAGPPTDIEITGGEAQTGAAGELLPQPIAATVTDDAGRPVPGARVVWEITNGDGEATPASALTNTSGVATTSWRIGSVAGTTQTMRAIVIDTISGVMIDAASVVAFGEPGAAAQVLRFTEQQQDVNAGVLSTPAFRVRVVDAHGNAIPGAAVQWTATAGSGTLATTTTVADAEGYSTNAFTAAPTAATSTVTVRSGAASTTFTLRIFNAAPTVATLGGSPYGIALAPTGQVVVANIGSGKFQRFPSSNPAALGQADLGGNPVNVIVNTAATFAWVTNMASIDQGLQIVNLATLAVDPVAIPNGGHALAWSPDSSRAFVTSSTSNVWILDVATRTIVDTILVAGGPWGLAFRTSGADTVVYVSMRETGAIVEANARTGAVLRTFNLGGRPHGIAISADGSTLWIANESLGLVQRFNTTTGTVTASIPLVNAIDVSLSSDGATLFAASHAGLAMVVDVPTFTPRRYYRLDGSGQRLAPRPDNGSAYLTVNSGTVVTIAR